MFVVHSAAGDVGEEGYFHLTQCIYVYILILMETTLQQWGNSVGVRIPKEILRKLTLEKNTPVQLRVQKNGILITPAPVKKETPTLHRLVRNITKENTHTETEWGSAQGNEVW